MKPTGMYRKCFASITRPDATRRRSGIFFESASRIGHRIAPGWTEWSSESAPYATVR
jgi:hypothetical protein